MNEELLSNKENDNQMSGYPSIDKPWLKYYDENAEEVANNIPENKTVWDVIEESLYKYIDIPALEYFGRVISRKEFIDNVYLWAKSFKALGVKEDEVVAYYGPFMPDICYMTFALNIIGACPYFLKLAISPEALAEETKDCKLAIVFDQMWENVKDEFSKDRFDTVIFARITDAMPAPKKQIVSYLSSIKGKVSIPKEKKYISVPKARDFAKYYDGEVNTPFVSDREAFITSSSGTTVGGIVKGTVATNESTISQLYMGAASKIQFFAGDRCLNHFPPTASTSLNVLFMLALYKGETVVIDPRVSENDFYNQITKLKPNMVLTTGSSWEAFFNRIENDIKKGKTYDFTYAKGWVVGGEGTDNEKFKKWYEIMKDANAYNIIFSGYGSSELFSATSCETIDARYDFSKQIMSVGIPYAGINMAVFDENGDELKYNQRGELRIKSRSAMKEYYNKPELTAQTKVDGWIRTGDLAEIDENGFVYIWGRVKDTTKLPDGREIYLFDVANKIKENASIDDAIVLEKPIDHDSVSLVAHIVWNPSTKEEAKTECLKEIIEAVKLYEPSVNLIAFAVHDVMMPYSPTTLKKDKNKMTKQSDGFIQVADGTIERIQFCDNENGLYSIKKLDK